MKTYVEESASNIVIKPIPNVNKPYPSHITGRYRPVLETVIPEIIDDIAPPKENGSILRHDA